MVWVSFCEGENDDCQLIHGKSRKGFFVGGGGGFYCSLYVYTNINLHGDLHQAPNLKALWDSNVVTELRTFFAVPTRHCL
jgi:hypothetical protein